MSPAIVYDNSLKLECSKLLLTIESELLEILHAQTPCVSCSTSSNIQLLSSFEATERTYQKPSIIKTSYIVDTPTHTNTYRHQKTFTDTIFLSIFYYSISDTMPASARDPQRVFPGEVRTSAAIKQKLEDQDALLEQKERDLVYKPRTITMLKKTISNLEKKIRDPKSRRESTHRLECSTKQKVLKAEEAKLKDLPKEIKALKREIKDLKDRLTKAKAEEQMAHAKANLTDSDLRPESH